MTTMRRAFLQRHFTSLALRKKWNRKKLLQYSLLVLVFCLLLHYWLAPEARNRPLLSTWFTHRIVYVESDAQIREWPGPIERSTEFLKPKLMPFAICSGCRLNEIDADPHGMTCGLWMHKYMKQTNETTGRADLQVSKRFPRQCQRCAPSACSALEKKYWPLDHAAPRVLSSRSLRMNFPEYYRLPEAALDDLEGFFRDRKRQHPYVFEWNPSVVVIPEDQIPERHLANSMLDTPFYLAVFRITKKQNCFRTDRAFQVYMGHKAPQYKTDFVDLAGIALLREDFSIIEEGFFDFRRKINKLQDLRLHVFPPKEGEVESRVYISSLEEVTQLWLRPPSDAVNKRLYYDFFERSANALVVFLEDRASCCIACRGKNFNYFQDNTGRIVVETLPFGPHTVEDVDFDADCYDNATWSSQLHAPIIDPYVPRPSFATQDELYFLDRDIFYSPYSNDHGTACCIPIPDPHNKDETLLVGISHTKSMLNKEDKMRMRKAKVQIETRQYISRFYAFEPRPPYRLVALSGGFCMPFPNAAEFRENYNNKLTKDRPYRLGKELGCPYITFLSGITEKANDPEGVIISYGVNDCTNRIVEVAKAEIVQMLFDPLARLASPMVG